MTTVQSTTTLNVYNYMLQLELPFPINPYMPADKQDADQIPPEVEPEEKELEWNGDDDAERN